MTAAPGTGKYARRELERRFLLDAVPPGVPSATAAIEDRYIVGTTLRLRRVTRDGLAVHKLTQKRDGWITTVYLSAEEHRVFAALPAEPIAKTRLYFPPLAVDVIAPDLIVAEIEFDTEAEMAAYRPPDLVVREITGDAAFTMAALATARAAM